jgi:membrane protease YdiL (CAAX protease family)
MVPGKRVQLRYLELSRRPLHMLVFLLPLVVLYEAGSNIYLANAAQGTVETIRAHSILLGFFQDFGIVGRFLPALAMVAVLLTWHILRDDRWKVRPLVLGGLVVESLVWTIPLVVLIAIVQSTGSAAGARMAAAGLEPIIGMPWEARLTISIGAGLYEELLFRMIGIAALHLVLVDLVRLPDRWGTGLAVFASAAAFVVYHDIGLAGQIDLLRALALMCAGVYFGVIYLTRGFAVVVGVHALYDIFVLVVLPQGV